MRKKEKSEHPKVIAIHPARSCGPCTACCDGWVRGTIRGHEMMPGTPCHFRQEITDNCGCSIYKDRPRDPCRNFVCEWLAADSPFPDSFRPDLLKVIITRLRWRNTRPFMLIPAGRPTDPALLQWMRDLALRTGQPLVYEEHGNRVGFGPPEFTEAVRRGGLGGLGN
ncbi:MAG TPA: hypothetical protein VLV56_18615 [Burkholderiales bacterium]|nr:hypothetical protein [Burkholderiales bacterium]